MQILSFSHAPIETPESIAEQLLYRDSWLAAEREASCKDAKERVRGGDDQEGIYRNQPTTYPKGG